MAVRTHALSYLAVALFLLSSRRGPRHCQGMGVEQGTLPTSGSFPTALTFSNRSLQKQEGDLGPKLTLLNSNISNICERSPDILFVKLSCHGRNLGKKKF